MEDDDREDSFDDQKERDDEEIFRHLIFGHKSSFIQFWDVLDTAASLLSVYIYAWIACFGIAEGSPGLIYISILFEVIFSLSIILRFITDYTPAGETQPEREFTKIYTRYLKSDFLIDFIACIPLNFIYGASRDHHYRIFYSIKLLRMIKGFKVFNVPLFMNKIKKVVEDRNKKKMENNGSSGEIMDEDNTNIEMLLNISYGVKTFRLIMIIINISYFIGMFWLITIDYIDSFKHERGEDGQLHNNCEKESDHHEEKEEEVLVIHDFIEEYKLNACNVSDYRRMLVVLYFAFTSLSTVGFGDFHPISSVERLVCSFILLFGVAIFSYIMGIFISILDQYG